MSTAGGLNGSSMVARAARVKRQAIARVPLAQRLSRSRPVCRMYLNFVRNSDTVLLG